MAAGLHGRHAMLLVPLLAATGLGLLDDVGDLPAPLRLAAEAVIGIVVVAVAGPSDFPVLVLILGVAATAVNINAVNLIDGLDGLAAGVVLASAIGFAVVLEGSGQALSLALAGASAGFLVFNRPPARIFLGDAGSYLMGTAQVVLLMLVWSGGGAADAVAAIAFVAVPGADLAVTITRRARAGVPLLQGDRGHSYDQLVDRGWSRRSAAAALVGAQGALTVIGVVASYQSPAAAWLIIGLGGVATIAAITAGGFLRWSSPTG
jgi:UDP-N-acetylmuramyl pentapeptide phosphotransferase/UDP-N-acetylglucosamine-1-phosphate transferase